MAVSKRYGGRRGIVVRILITIVAAALLLVAIFAPNSPWLTITLATLLLAGLAVMLVFASQDRRRSSSK